MEIQIVQCFSTCSLPTPRHNIRSTTTITTSLLSKQKTRPLLANNILNTLDALVCRFLDRRPLHPDSDPKNSMSENYSPVDELPPTPCPVVVGPLPPSLDGGAYIRNGPNPHFFPTGPHHVLDGDGMLHVIRISGGQATFCSRYVKTHKYLTERHIGNPVVPNFVGAFNGLAATLARSALFAARVLLARQLDPFGKGAGVANTSIAVLAGGRKLLALCESDLPYEIQLTDDGDVTTLGRHDFDSVDEPSFVRMTAHPKVDPKTGMAFAFRYAFLFRPFLTFHRIDRDGRKLKDVPILSKTDCSIMHDFGLTENHAVFPDIQLAINPAWIFARDRGTPVGIDHRKVPRLGVIPREAEDGSTMMWVDSPGLNMVHCVNAWEQDNKIVMVVTNVLNPEYFISQTGLSEVVLEKVTVDMKTKSVTRQRLSLPGKCNEFGTINPAYASNKVRYVYLGVLESKSITGVEKFDLSLIEDVSCMVASRMYGPGCYGGEPFFVAKEPNNPMADEDDGYLVTYVHDENTRESRFIVMDAKSPDLDIIAAVKLPQRIPSGFHGLFISETELTKLGK